MIDMLLCVVRFRETTGNVFKPCRTKRRLDKISYGNVTRVPVVQVFADEIQLL